MERLEQTNGRFISFTGEIDVVDIFVGTWAEVPVHVRWGYDPLAISQEHARAPVIGARHHTFDIVRCEECDGRDRYKLEGGEYSCISGPYTGKRHSDRS